MRASRRLKNAIRWTAIGPGLFCCLAPVCGCHRPRHVPVSVAPRPPVPVALAPDSADEWRQADGNGGRTRSLPTDIRPPLRLAWQVPFMQDASHLAASGAVVYVGLFQGGLLAVDAAQGHVRWTRTEPSATSFYFRDKFAASDDGVLLYVTRSRRLEMLNAGDGSIRWAIPNLPVWDATSLHATDAVLLTGPTAYLPLDRQDAQSDARPRPYHPAFAPTVLTPAHPPHGQRPADDVPASVSVNDTNKYGVGVVALNPVDGATSSLSLFDLTSMGDDSAFYSFEPHRLGVLSPGRFFLQDARMITTTAGLPGPVLGVRYLNLTSGPAAAMNGRVFYEEVAELTDHVTALNERGRLLWQTALGADKGYADPGTQSIGGYYGEYVHLVLARGRVLVIIGNSLCCLSQVSGKILWKAAMTTSVTEVWNVAPGAARTGVTQVLAAGRFVYAVVGQDAHGTSQLLAYNLGSGRRLWHLPIRGGIAAMIAHKGALYLLRDDSPRPVPAPGPRGSWLMKLSPDRPGP